MPSYTGITTLEVDETAGGLVATQPAPSIARISTDPTKIQKKDEKGNALGYPELDAAALVPSDQLAPGTPTGLYLSGQTWVEIRFARGGSLVGSSGVPTGNYMVWRAPFACEVLNVRGWRAGGSGATVNARRNGSSTHLASNLSLVAASTWYDGGAVQNITYATGDTLEIMVVTATGSPTQIVVQVDFRRT